MAPGARASAPSTERGGGLRHDGLRGGPHGHVGQVLRTWGALVWGSSTRGPPGLRRARCPGAVGGGLQVHRA